MPNTITFRSRRTAVGVGAALSLAAASLTGIAMAPAAQASTVATLSASSGPAAGGNNLTVNLGSAVTTPLFVKTSVVQFQYKATTATICPATYVLAVDPSVPVDAADTHFLNSKKLVVTVPALPGPATSTGNFLLCTYPGAAGALTSSSPYSVAVPPSITIDDTGVVPATGPATGGNTITIKGTDFVVGATSAKIGTQPLTGVVVATTKDSLTGVVPAQSSAVGLDVTVTTLGGTSVKWAGGTYLYTNGIGVSPNTTPTGIAATDLDVTGVGFGSYDFGAGSTTGSSIAAGDAGAHVYLFQGPYNATTSATGATFRTANMKGECLNVLPISDTELMCTLDTEKFDGTAATPIAEGTYTLTVVAIGTQAYATPRATIVSSGSTFTVGAY